MAGKRRLNTVSATYQQAAALGQMYPVSSFWRDGDSHLSDDFPVIPPVIPVEMPTNRWLKLHLQNPGDQVRFNRQEYGGSCFDTKRGRLILFESNTHGKNWYICPDRKANGDFNSR